MSDFASSLPVRTQSPGDVVTILADATNPATQQAAVDTHGSVVITPRDASGTAYGITNPLPVYLQDFGTSINNYNTAAAIAAGSSSNHQYTVTASKTLHLTQIHASASGKLKIEVGIETGVGTGIFNSVFVGFNSTSNPNIQIPLTAFIEVAAGVRVQIIRTNEDKVAQDLYSTVCGHEQ